MFRCCSAYVFVHFLRTSSEKHQRKIFFCQVLGFVSRSLGLRFFSLSSLFAFFLSVIFLFFILLLLLFFLLLLLHHHHHLLLLLLLLLLCFLLFFFLFFFVFSFFFCLSNRERSGSHRSHAHSPCTFLVLVPFGLLFCPLVRCVVFCSHPFRCASFFFLRFVGGVFCASVRFWDSLGTRALLHFQASDPVSWTLGGGVFGFSVSRFCFPLLLCLRPHTCF